MAMTQAAANAKTLTSFSGADLVVTFGPRAIGELQQISWAIQREKAPIFTLGNPDPRSFSRGKRGIAGSLVFVVFDRDALIQELRAVWDQIAPVAMFTAAGNKSLGTLQSFEQALSLTGWNNASTVQAGQDNGAQGSYNNLDANNELTPNSTFVSDGVKVNVPPGFASINATNIVYADMLPPFDVTMTFANEYGQAAFQKIYDVDILNESSGVSVDSIVMERQLTYIARRISPIMSGVYVRDQSGAIVDTKPVVAQ
jgi:hypothetical protein